MPLPPGAGCCAHKYYSRETDGPTEQRKMTRREEEEGGRRGGGKETETSGKRQQKFNRFRATVGITKSWWRWNNNNNSHQLCALGYSTNFEAFVICVAYHHMCSSSTKLRTYYIFYSIPIESSFVVVLRTLPLFLSVSLLLSLSTWQTAVDDDDVLVVVVVGCRCQWLY